MVPNTVTAPDETTDGLPRNNGTLCGNRPVGRSVRLPSVAQLPEHQRSFTVYCALTPCSGDLEKIKAVRLQVFMTATMKDTLLCDDTVQFGTVAIYQTATQSQSYSKITPFNEIRNFTIPVTTARQWSLFFHAPGVVRILKWVLNRMEGCELGSLAQWASSGEYGKEASGSIKGAKFFVCVQVYRVVSSLPVF
jgi:hypothetical protein